MTPVRRPRWPGASPCWWGCCVSPPRCYGCSGSRICAAPVMLGYLAGSAVVIFAGQIGVLIGVPAKGDGALPELWYVATHLDQAHATTAAVGLSVVAALLLLRRVPYRIPATLLVLLAATVVSAVSDLSERGMAVVGAVTRDMLLPGITGVTGSELRALLPAAAGIAFIASVETVYAIRRTEVTAAGRVPRRESVALGAASVASGVLGGFAPSGSTAKSLSARSAGARSQLFQIGVAVLVVLVLITGGPVVSALPLAALAATVIAGTVPHLIDVPGFLAVVAGLA